MAFVLDVIMIVIAAAGLIVGWKRGFVKSLFSLISSLLAILIASLLTGGLSQWLNDKYVYPLVNDKVDEAIVSVAGSGENAIDMETLLADVPEPFVKMLATFGVDPDDMKKDLSSELEQGGDTLRKAVVMYIAKPIADVIATAATFLALFIVTLIILKIIAALLDGIMKLPVLKTMNAALGLVFGGIASVLIVWGLSVALAKLMPVLSSLYPDTVSETTIENTLIVRFFSEHSIISVLNRL